MKTYPARLIGAALAALLTIPTGSVADEPIINTDFLIILASGDKDVATRCTQIATQLHEAGRGVDMFLMDDGVMYSVFANTKNVRAATGDYLSTHMQYVVEKAIPVCVCTPCAAARKLDAAEMIPSARLCAKPDVVNLMSSREVVSCF